MGPLESESEQPFNAIQPTLITHADGRLQALCRTKERVIVTTESADGGKSWSKLTPLGLPNPNSGIDAVSLKDGRFLLIYNHLDGTKSPLGTRGLLNLAVSDDGKQWNRAGVVEQQAEVSSAIRRSFRPATVWSTSRTPGNALRSSMWLLIPKKLRPANH